MLGIVLNLAILVFDNGQAYAESSGNDYYEVAKGKCGTALKEALHEIIKDHKVLKYTNSNNKGWSDRINVDVWEALVYTDSGCSDTSLKCKKVQLLYPNETRGLSDAYRGVKTASADNWEREHVWPKSRGFSCECQDGFTDLHHIRPADRDINQKHSNYGYGEGGAEVMNQCKTVGCPKLTEAKFNKEAQSFEPPDRAKGQVARMLFYMAVRYGEEDSKAEVYMPDLYLKDKNARVKEPWIGRLSILLEWNRSYQPSDFERRRNDRVMELQLNRNPFIDDPSFADKIWDQNHEEAKECYLAPDE